MTYALELPKWIRVYAVLVAGALLLVGLFVHIVGSLALAANVNPLLGLATLALIWPITGIVAISLALLWLASVVGLWKLARFLLSSARLRRGDN